MRRPLEPGRRPSFRLSKESFCKQQRNPPIAALSFEVQPGLLDPSKPHCSVPTRANPYKKVTAWERSPVSVC